MAHEDHNMGSKSKSKRGGKFHRGVHNIANPFKKHKTPEKVKVPIRLEL